MANYSGGTLNYNYRIAAGWAIDFVRNPDLDLTFDAQEEDKLEYGYRIRPDWSEDGDATFYTDIDDYWLQYGDDIGGEFFSSVIISGSTLNYGQQIYGDLIRSAPSILEGLTSVTKIPRVKWSKIGEFDFTKDKTNVAGDMTLDHDGVVYQIAKLGSQVVVYTSGGITILNPAKGGGYGKQRLSDVGLLTPWCWAGTEGIHFFINFNMELCQVTPKGLETLGYQELMQSFVTGIPTLVLDIFNELLYIGDGGVGYIYSILDKCMSQGPDEITGCIPSPGLPAAAFVAADTITVPDFNLVTDIVDFNTRKFKTITHIEVSMHSDQTWDGTGQDAGEDITVRVHFRDSMYNTAWATTPWCTIGPDGIADCRAYGREFKIELFCDLGTASFDLDEIKIKGFIHDYNPMDA